MNVSSIRLRALRNAATAGAATAVVGFSLVAALGRGGTEPVIRTTTPPTTSSPPPVVCGDAFEAVPSADPSAKGNALLGVAAPAPDDAWAVGSTGPRDTLIERWDGTSWAPVYSPNGDLRRNVLAGVAAITPDDVWAVGGSSLGAQSQALIEHWDGATWSVVPAPADAPAGSTLAAVFAFSPDDVWAVGGSGDTLHENGTALILHWNGTGWTVIPGATLGAGGSFLFDVAGVAGAPPQVWAVGYDFPDTFSSTQSTPVLERWDGTAWAVVPNAGTQGDSLRALGVVAPDAIWAVGDPIQAWDGQTWTAVGSPMPGVADLHDVLATGEPWAVGFLTGNETGNRALIERWDGRQWSIIPPPSSDDASETLAAVAAFDDGGVWAVGSRVTADGEERTLILRRSCG